MSHAVEVTAMGTVVGFLVPDPRVASLLAAPIAEMQRLEALLSPYQPASEVARLARGEPIAPGPELAEILALCEEAHALSDGLFDPWALPGGFDPSGLAKGWIVERVVAACLAEGIDEVVVEAGGDVAVATRAPEIIGVRHPEDPAALAAVVEVASAVATSGCYERGAHLVHPRGGLPLATSATVIGGPLWLADAMATAACLGGAEALASICLRTGLTGFVTTPDQRLISAPGTPLVWPRAS
jgi:thiamine biosynthesis lipoprotein